MTTCGYEMKPPWPDTITRITEFMQPKQDNNQTNLSNGSQQYLRLWGHPNPDVDNALLCINSSIMGPVGRQTAELHLTVDWISTVVQLYQWGIWLQEGGDTGQRIPQGSAFLALGETSISSSSLKRQRNRQVVHLKPGELSAETHSVDLGIQYREHTCALI